MNSSARREPCGLNPSAIDFGCAISRARRRASAPRNPQSRRDERPRDLRGSEGDLVRESTREKFPKRSIVAEERSSEGGNEEGRDIGGEDCSVAVLAPAQHGGVRRLRNDKLLQQKIGHFTLVERSREFLPRAGPRGNRHRGIGVRVELP